MTEYEKQRIELLQQRTGHTFKDIRLALIAIVHSSYASTNHRIENNERLEFLGDAVLDLVIGETLYLRFQDRDEGDLTRMRAWLVNEEQLASAASRMDLGALLLLGRSELNSGGSSKASILADLFEAVTGAIYLDGGIEAARRFLLSNLESAISAAHDMAFKSDAKSELQEFTQKKFGYLPEYITENMTGPAHARTFHVSVHIEGRRIASGTGHSKKEAQQVAAARAIRYLRRDR